MAERGFAQPRRSLGARLRRFNIGPSDRDERYDLLIDPTPTRIEAATSARLPFRYSLSLRAWCSIAPRMWGRAATVCRQDPGAL